MYKNVVFVGLNQPGSNNKVNAGACVSSKSVRTQTDCDADNAEYADRNAHNIAWLQQSFTLAKQRGAAGVMIVTQGDPGFDLPETESVNERLSPDSDGYTDFLNALVAEVRGFNGQVVLVHGDTHFFKIDKPLVTQSELVPNITRVETFGSPNVHWIKVMVEPNSPDVFDFQPVIVSGNWVIVRAGTDALLGPGTVLLLRRLLAALVEVVHQRYHEQRQHRRGEGAEDQ